MQKYSTIITIMITTIKGAAILTVKTTLKDAVGVAVGNGLILGVVKVLEGVNV